MGQLETIPPPLHPDAVQITTRHPAALHKIVDSCSAATLFRVKMTILAISVTYICHFMSRRTLLIII